MTKTLSPIRSVRVIGRTIHQVEVLFRNPKNAQCAKLGSQQPYNAVVRLLESNASVVEDMPMVEGTLAEIGVNFATHNEIISLAFEEPELLTDYRLATVVDGNVCLIWGTHGHKEIDFNVIPKELPQKELPLLLVFACKIKSGGKTT